MKIKGLPDKIRRVSPNHHLFNISFLSKLRKGESVDVPSKAAKELIKMGVAIKPASRKYNKKESK